MILVILSTDNLATVRNALKPHLPKIKYSHLTEALARGLGFSTHADALSHIRSLSSPEVCEFRHEAFLGRLTELGYVKEVVGLDARLIASVGIPTAPAVRNAQDRVSWHDSDVVLLEVVAIGPPVGMSRGLRAILAKALVHDSR